MADEASLVWQTVWWLPVLSELLIERASRVAVRGDLEAILARPPVLDPDSSVKARRQRAGWLLAAAAVLVVGAAGAYLINSDTSGERLSADESAQVGPASQIAAAVSEASDAELIIWLEPTADRAAIEAIESWLDDNTAVERYEYVGKEATYSEFAAYYSSQPDMLELVTPDQLPTSFRVATTEASLLAPIIETLPSVAGVDIEQ